MSFALINLALNLAPLFISYGKDALNLPAKNVIVFTAIFFVSSILFGTILPLLADRSGFKLIGMIAALLSFISFAIPLLPGTGAIALYTAYTFHSTSSMLAALLLANLGAELMPDIGPTSIIIVGSILIMPLTVVFPPLGGTLVDLFAATGYQIVFAGGAIISLLSAIILGLGVIEPRHQELLPEIFPSGTSQEP
jgi:MFS family permease